MKDDYLNQITRHHRKPKSIGGCDEHENISKIKMKHHVAWHVLFGNMTAQEIAEEINKKYLDPSFNFVVKRTGYEHKSKRIKNR